MEYNTYKKAVELQDELTELQTMLNAIPFPDKDTPDKLIISSPNLKLWLKTCIANKIRELGDLFNKL